MKDRNFYRFGGAVIGAWLALVYAFISLQAVRLSLPDLPLRDPTGGTLGYFFSFALVGTLLGLAVCWPEKTWLGALAGIGASAVLIFLLPWKDPLGPPGQTIGVQFHFLATYTAPVVFMLVMTFMARLTINYLPDRPQGGIVIGRFAWPLAATALAVVLGSLAAYPPAIQDGLRSTQGLVQQGLQATGPNALPGALKGVQGWFPNAAGQYALEWSAALGRFKGPLPAKPYTANEFLVIVRFENQFTFACIYGPEIEAAVCANYE